MSIFAVARTRRNGRRLHPLPVRIMHWINAVAMLIMITSGWGIYDDDVIIRIAVAAGAPLSTALLGLDGLFGLRGWQIMYLAEPRSRRRRSLTASSW